MAKSSTRLTSELNTSVPAALVSYRTVVQKYPDAVDETTLAKLAEMYEEMNRFELAARTLDDLAQRFPNNTRDAAWDAGELYEKKVKNMELARAAYSRVPPTSKRFRTHRSARSNSPIHQLTNSPIEGAPLR